MTENEPEAEGAAAELLGYALEACPECECDANSYHHPGCSGAPYVCPGCFAFNGEPCAGYCPDAAIEREREERLEHDWEPIDLNGDSNDWEFVP